MFPAARVGDPITHDNNVPSGVISPPGVPTVLIEYFPAAVMGNQVACTGAISGGIAHPPMPPLPNPPIILGCPTVLIGYMPAARWIASTTACGAFLGLLPLMATRTVFIGDIGGAGGGAGGGGAAGAGPGGTPTKVIEAYTNGTSAPVGPVPPEQTGPLQPEEEEKEKTWIGIRLRDFDGSPMPNQSFQVTLQGGRALSGSTDEKGYARFENIDRDQGEVAFTEIPESKEAGTGSREKESPEASKVASHYISGEEGEAVDEDEVGEKNEFSIDSNEWQAFLSSLEGEEEES